MQIKRWSYANKCLQSHHVRGKGSSLADDLPLAHTGNSKKKREKKLHLPTIPDPEWPCFTDRMQITCPSGRFQEGLEAAVPTFQQSGLLGCFKEQNQQGLNEWFALLLSISQMGTISSQNETYPIFKVGHISDVTGTYYTLVFCSLTCHHCQYLQSAWFK